MTTDANTQAAGAALVDELMDAVDRLIDEGHSYRGAVKFLAGSETGLSLWTVRRLTRLHPLAPVD